MVLFRDLGRALKINELESIVCQSHEVYRPIQNFLENVKHISEKCVIEICQRNWTLSTLRIPDIHGGKFLWNWLIHNI